MIALQRPLFLESDQDLQLRVLTLIRQYRGRACAVTAKDLADLLQIRDPRTVRDAVSQLRKRDYCICSTTNEPAGFFWPVTQGEIEETDRHLSSREAEISQVLRGFRRGCRTEFESAHRPPLL